MAIALHSHTLGGAKRVVFRAKGQIGTEEASSVSLAKRP